MRITILKHAFFRIEQENSELKVEVKEQAKKIEELRECLQNSLLKLEQNKILVGHSHSFLSCQKAFSFLKIYVNILGNILSISLKRYLLYSYYHCLPL